MTPNAGRDQDRPGDASNPDRRDFSKALLAGVLTGPAMLSASAVRAAEEPSLPDDRSGVKLAVQMNHVCGDPTNPTDEDLLFVRQLGVGWVTIGLGDDQATADVFRKTVDRYRAAGIRVWNIGNSSVHNMEEVTLNLPNRDKKIDEYIRYLHNVHEAGLTYTTYAHMGNGIWSTGSALVRGARARVFDLSEAKEGVWRKVFRGPLTHGRRYSEEEIWENYATFIKRVVPVAEKLGIRIGIHPDDPPVPELGGVPRCIFSSFDGYRRALEIADSDNVGICLCVGCWAEGGDRMGRSAVETIRHFGRQGKLFKVHFRNVSSPLPRFTETFLDNGYLDMAPVMKALVDVGFQGAVIPDHIPRMVGAPHAGVAHSIGYMRALLQRAERQRATVGKVS
ncbi:MAG: mannonate dehydratase [Planctomycetota bacterium]|jgi:mannonate dehydratase